MICTSARAGDQRMDIILDPLLTFADKVGLIRAFKNKLISQPSCASADLTTVLQEISKIYGAIDAELLRYLGLRFDPDHPFDETNVLLELQGGQVQVRMAQARGHCKKILNIYHTYLNPWFAQVLNGGQQGMMNELFLSMDEFDGLMIRSIDNLAQWLETEAARTLDLVNVGDLAGAKQRVLSAQKELLPSRRSISRIMTELFDLQAEFIEKSGAT